MSLALMDVAVRLSAELQTGGTYKARCPVHNDNKPSLEIKQGDNGGVLVLCRVCGKDATPQILATAGMTLADLMPPRENGHGNLAGVYSANGRGKPKKEIDATYDYTDEKGTLLFQKIRYRPKNFSLWQPNGHGSKTWNMQGARRVLYKLPRLIQADPEHYIYVAEGEKDVDRLEKLGFLATCNFDGAKKWLPDYNECFRGRHVVIIPDNDDDGRAHAQLVANNIRGIAASIRILTLPGLPPKGDLSDWADAGGTDEQLGELTEACPLWQPGTEPVAEESSDKPASEWDEIGPPKSVVTLVADHPQLRAEIIHGLLRRGETMNVISGTKLGKSWLSYGIALCVVTGKRLWDTFLPVPGKVLLIDNEIHPETLAFRIPRVAKAYGIEPADYQESLHTVTLRGRNMDMHAIGRYLGNIEPGTYSLVVIDALYRTYPEDTDENSNADMTRLFNLVDQIAAKLNSAIALVHHTTKGLQSGKQVTDVGSGAGAQSRACDTHLILRPHENEKAVVAEAALRSFGPVQPLCLEFDWPLWKLAGHLDPADLKTEKPKPNLERVASKILVALADGPKTRNALRDRIGRNTATTVDGIELLLGRGEIVACKVALRNGEYDGFEIPKSNPDQPGLSGLGPTGG